jgi:STE24 endopeptidase
MSEMTAMRMCTVEGVDRGRLRLPIALVAAVAVAEAAVLLLRPREGVIDPERVNARSYFSPAELERARDFRRPQLALFGVALVVQGALLVVLVRRPPRVLVRDFRRPLLAGAAAGAALSVALGAATLPLDAVRRQRALDVGLATQSWGGWAVDVGKSAVIGAILSGAGAAILLGLQRRFPRHWWAPGSACVVAIGAVFLYAGPVVLDPVFNRFTPLPSGQARSDVLELARQAGVNVGEVYEVDASRRTTAANAYVTGLGSTKRVVLYDTLLENFNREEMRLVVAHELAHVRHRDVRNGLLYLALVAPAALFAAQRLSERLAGGRGGTPAALPAVVLSIALVAGAVGVVSNQLSRRVEARADAFSLRLTREPGPFISFERRISVRNVSDPDPPDWVTFLLATHPPTIERIGAAVAFERGR